MKSIFSKILVICSAVLLFTGCKDDAAYYLGGGADSGTANDNLYLEDGSIDPEKAGYLTLSSDITCVLDGEIIANSSSSASQNQGGSSVSKAVSKAQTIAGTIEQASDDYIITITLDREGLTAEEIKQHTHTYTYGEIKAAGATGIALMPGVYRVEAQSPANDNNAEWNAPTYYAKVEDQTITKKQTTAIDALVCKLSNIKTTVEFSADMYELFRADNPSNPSKNLMAKLSLGGASMEFTREIVTAGNKAAYFFTPAEENDLTINLFGEFNTADDNSAPSYTDIAGWQQTIGGVRAGQWRKIKLNVLYAHDGNTKIEVTVETWVYDEVIDVDTKSFAITQDADFGEVELDDEENEITDALSPVVTLEGGLDFGTPFDINAAMYDFDMETCLTSIKGSITPTVGSEIKSIMVEFASDNDKFTQYLVGEGYYKGRVDLYPTNKASELIKVAADNSITNSAPYKVTVLNDGMMKLSNYEGEIKAKVVAIDNLDRESYNILTINIDRTGMPGVVLAPPAVVWRGGYSFEEQHNVYALEDNNIPIILDITSKTGITAFKVEISGSALPPSELAVVGLAAEMDLINPATEQMKTQLKSFGFPVGDEVENQKALVFDITSFMPMLVQIADSGADANFKLSVTDQGGTTTKTIKVVVSK